jgi:chromosome partitioning protein
MLRVAIMNAKGGCGKTTVATNLASHCVSQGYATALFDYDPQGSSSRWLKSRPQERPSIHGVAAYEPPSAGITRSWQLRIPPQTRYVIRDTPAGYTGIELEDRLHESDIILIPVLPSVIDMHSTANFIRDLLLIGKARARGKKIAIIANRTRIRTRSLINLERFLRNLDIPVIAQIRDTQHYVHAAEHGIGVCELAESTAQQDSAPWTRILEWIQQHDREDHGFSAPVSRVLPCA